MTGTDSVNWQNSRNWAKMVSKMRVPWLSRTQIADLIKLATRPGLEGKAIFCRSSDAARPLEWQSNYFASCLLMPKRNVQNAWNQTFGPGPMIIHRAKKTGIRIPALVEACAENWFQI